MKDLIYAWLVWNPFFFGLGGALLILDFFIAICLNFLRMDYGYLAISTKNYSAKLLVIISVIC